MNNYVFLEKFTISLDVQVTLNREVAKDLDIEFKAPDLNLNLVLGSMVDRNEFLSIEVEEEQMEALLHIGTFFSALSNFSKGVTRNLFHSSKAKMFCLEDREEYVDLFTNYLNESC